MILGIGLGRLVSPFYLGRAVPIFREALGKLILLEGNVDRKLGIIERVFGDVLQGLGENDLGECGAFGEYSTVYGLYTDNLNHYGLVGLVVYLRDLIC